MMLQLAAIGVAETATKAGHTLGSWLIPGLVIFLFIAILLIIKVMVNRYQKIPPNKVAIIYGRGAKTTGTAGQGLGCKVVSGGGVFVWPVFQSIDFMDTAVFRLTIEENNIPNKDTVKISVKGVAVCKISTAPEDLQSAAMSFLGQSQEQIQETICAALIGHVRSIIGKLDINGILRDRDQFNKMVVDESTGELKRMGVQIVTLVIQEVTDEHGYIDAQGKKTVAQAIRDGNIAEAEAQAETAKRISTAQREAAVVAAANAVAVAEAERDRDIKKAQFKKAADTEQAAADNAKAIATAAQQETLRVAEARRDAAAAEAQIAVQEKEAARREKQLIVEVIRPAEAQRNAAVITADGQRQAALIVADSNQKTAVIEADGAKQAAVLNAEAAKEVAVRKAEGEGEAARRLGEGQAAQTLATMTAQANGSRAQMEAQAAGTRAQLMAKADGDAAQKGRVLEAEAEGTRKLAEALRQMTDSAKLILILDRLPILLDHGGDAFAKALSAVFGPVAAGIANVDHISITDIGGTGRGLNQVGNLVPQIVTDTIVALKAKGVDVEELLKKVGANPAGLMQLLAAAPAAASTAAAPVADAAPAADSAPRA